MKLLSLAVALAAILQVSEAIAQKPFFPSASAPTSDEVGTAGLAFKQTSSNAYDNPNSRPQISPPFQGQKPQISPVYQGQQSQNQGQTRPQVQPVQGQTGPGPHVVQPIVQDKPQISPVDPSATDSHKVEPRQLTSYQQGETSYGSPSNTLYQQQAGYNWGYSGSTGGTIACTVCSPNVYTYAQKCCSLGYTQCCNVGVHGGNYNNGGYNSYQAQLYPQHQGYQYSTYNSYPNSQWSISSWPYSAGGGLGYQQGWNSLGSGYQNNQQQKPGSCYRGSTYPYQSNGGYNYNYNTNQNAGYYHTRRSVDAVSDDIDAKELVKREAPLASQSGGYQTYQSPGGYGYSSGNNGYSGGGYSGGGYNGGGGYSGGGYNGGGGFHGGNGITPSSTYRPGFGSGSGYCYRDYDCSGIKKCCSGVCTNPAAVIG